MGPDAIEPANRRRWVLEPPPGPRDAREDRTGEARELLAAVRSAAGRRVRIRLGVSRSGVSLDADDGVSARWVERSLLRAYDPHRWLAAPPTALGERRTDWMAVGGSASPSGNLPSDSLLDAACRAFRLAPRGAALAIVAKSTGRTIGRLSPSRGELPVRATGAAGRAYGARPSPPATPEVQPTNEWEVRLSLVVPPGGEGEVLARAMGAAFRTLDGRDVRFLRRSVLRPRALRLGDEALVRCLPTRDCPAGRPGPTPASNGIPLGRDDSGRAVYLPVEPGQGRHLAILGETGMGKSSLLRAIAVRTARSYGVLLLDPLGETARAVRDDLSRAGQPFRWISPVDAPVTLNALAVSHVAPARRETQIERRVQDLLYGLRRVRSGRYGDAPFWGPRLEEMLGRALRAAGRLPDGTLEDAHTLLATGGRIARPVPEEAAGPVRELAQRIRERPEDADGARRLLYEVVGSPLLRSLLCDPSPGLSIAELVAPDRIVLVSGDARSVGESNARYLLSVYLALLWSELLGRTTDAKTFVLLDEVQWFGHESLAEMLRLARRANVHAVLGTQGLGSLSEPIRDAVWTNVADFVAFRGAPDDARELARLTTGVRPDDVTRLPRGSALVLADKGHRVAWMRAARCPTEPPHAADPTPGPPGAGHRRPDSEDVLGALRRLGDMQSPGTLLSVRLRDLRRLADPAGAAVRAAGAALGRAGALVGTRATPEGPVWKVRVDRIPPAPAPPASCDPREISEPPQPSLSRNGSFP